MALSMPQPANAAIKCSMVMTVVPNSLPIIVHSALDLTRSQRACTRAMPGATSERKNQMPVSAGAGCNVMLTATPVWSAVPVQLMRFLSVRCSINSMFPRIVLVAA